MERATELIQEKRTLFYYGGVSNLHVSRFMMYQSSGKAALKNVLFSRTTKLKQARVLQSFGSRLQPVLHKDHSIWKSHALSMQYSFRL
jgi:hypothetical protein